ncbi:hypothetical protein [Bizionia paragorgiae]|uniref:hypothetical protein n=1 Tax=Bizionia paragorgiae TaxID=283786 RepID=UPI003A8F278A
MEGKENNSQTKNNNPIDKGNKLIEKGKGLVRDINNVNSQISNTLTNSGELIDKANDIGRTFIESKKIESETRLGLEKIRKNHDTIGEHIKTEYKKQKQQLDKAEEVIDDGLKSGNLAQIKLGLDAMTNVANHNPMTDLKNHLDNQIDENFDEDDDFVIEI